MTKIQWTDETANWIVGCTKTRAKGAKQSGCDKCYAATAASSARLQQFDQYKAVVDGNGNWNGNIEFVPKVLDDLLKGKRSRRVFTPSMSDPFHHNVKEEWLDQFMATVALTPHITYQVLTKRPDRMYEYFNDFDLRRIVGPTFDLTARNNKKDPGQIWKLPFRNLHLGVSVENQAAVDERIPLLLNTPAWFRFLSCEPLLEKIDLRWFLLCEPKLKYSMGGISQVIVGGESGSNARPFNLEWARSLRDQCQEAGVKYFFKQAGSNVWDKCPPPAHLADLGLITESYCQLKLRDRKGGDLSEIPEDLRIREIL
jgi:protein gp37